MSNISINNAELDRLNQEIFSLEQERNRLKSKIDVFQNELRAKFIEEIMEEQELSNLYREKQREKKAKRTAQKKKGKNYQEPKPALKTFDYDEEEEGELISFDEDDSVELKKIYRECMLLVHPDNFSMNDSEDEELAHSLTTQLIEIYRNGNMKALKNFKAHILAGNTALVKDKNTEESSKKFKHLETKIEDLKTEITNLKDSQLYEVILNKGESLYINQLSNYFDDRLAKLRKRLRIKK